MFSYSLIPFVASGRYVAQLAVRSALSVCYGVALLHIAEAKIDRCSDDMQLKGGHHLLLEKTLT